MHADPVKVRQNLLNLLGNACKFTQKGHVSLNVQRDGTWIVFAIKDTGIGMTPEQMTKIFQPFIQADSSTTRRYGGTGLGLSIAHRFCELMDGKITVESEVGRGTTFRMRLPAEVSPRPLVNGSNVNGRANGSAAHGEEKPAPDILNKLRPMRRLPRPWSKISRTKSLPWSRFNPEKKRDKFQAVPCRYSQVVYSRKGSRQIMRAPRAKYVPSR